MEYEISMTATDLDKSAATDASPPEGLSPVAKTLWLARAGKWDATHDLCQEIPGTAGSWIHAHLHREEGDLPNASYWYSRAGKRTPEKSLTIREEWLQLASSLL